MGCKEGEYYKGDKKECGFQRFLYTSDTKEVFGRTGLSWSAVKFTVFCIIFYACLTAFWAIMLILFYHTLDTIRPAWALDESAIGTVPVLGFRPRPPGNFNSTLIYFKAGNTSTWKYWADDIQDFLKDYEWQEADGENLRPCSFDQPIDPNENKACRFPLETIASNCSISQQFGYEYGKPCILLKFNKIIDWFPEAYDDSSFPPNIPHIIKDHYDGRYVYITCEGENMADVENRGPLVYYPGYRIENYYFPYRNTPGYQSPFVFVQFLRPERGVLINMECKLWAKNVEHDRQGRIGSVHFELMVD